MNFREHWTFLVHWLCHFRDFGQAYKTRQAAHSETERPDTLFVHTHVRFVRGIDLIDPFQDPRPPISLFQFIEKDRSLVRFYRGYENFNSFATPPSTASDRHIPQPSTAHHLTLHIYFIPLVSSDCSIKSMGRTFHVSSFD